MPFEVPLQYAYPFDHVLPFRSEHCGQSFEPLVIRCRIAALGDVRCFRHQVLVKRA